MQTATSETESKSLDLSICVQHNTLRAPCPKGRENEPSVAQGGGGVAARKTVVRAADQAWQTEAIKTGKTMKRTQERRSNTQFQKKATAKARA